MMNEASGCCRWRKVIGVAVVGIAACSLTAYAAMNAITSGSTSGTTGSKGSTSKSGKMANFTLGVELAEPFVVTNQEPGNDSLLRGGCLPGSCPVGMFCNSLTGFCEFIFPCHPLPCPPGSLLEMEPSCLLDADDTFNGGCNTSVGAVFSPLICNTTMCGETYRSGNRRDTDWFELILTQSTRITLIMTSDFEGAVTGFIQQIDGVHNWATRDEACLNLTGYITPVDFHTDQACGTSITVTECFPPGRIWAFAGSIGAAGAPVTFECHRYNLVVSCPESPCSEACCFGDGSCADLTGPECDRVGPTGRPTANSGTGLGAGTACDPGGQTPACQLGCGNATPISLGTNGIGNQAINNCTLYTSPGDANHPQCLEGDDTPPIPFYSCANGSDQSGTSWYSFVAQSTSVLATTCNSNPAGTGSPPGGGDPTMAVYGGACNGGFGATLTEIGCGEDDCGPAAAPWQAFICVSGLTVGNTYYIQFSAWDGAARGGYDLEVQTPCPALAPGPCCLPNGSCVIADPDACQNPLGLNGTYQGPLVPGTNDCQDLNDGAGGPPNGIPDACERGACCDASAVCFESTQVQCFGGLNGVSYTPGQTCTQLDQLTP
ncbi:MAG: hypothetical protein ACE5GE_12090, partial [Phycisphaerae bacterium]